MSEPKDIKPELEEQCRLAHCLKQTDAYTACAKRVAQDTTGEAHCTGQYFDLLKCIDACVSKQLFKYLK